MNAEANYAQQVETPKKKKKIKIEPDMEVIPACEGVARAERRRMMRDPLRIHKMIAGDSNHSEYARVVTLVQILLAEMSEIQMTMAGLGYHRLGNLAERQEKLTRRWNEIVEQIEPLQKKAEEIESSSKKHDDEQKAKLIVGENIPGGEQGDDGK